MDRIDGILSCELAIPVALPSFRPSALPSFYGHLRLGGLTSGAELVSLEEMGAA